MYELPITCWKQARKHTSGKILERDTETVTYHACKEHKEVEAPEHLKEPNNAKILANIVVTEVAKSSHPHVRCNEETDSIVLFTSVEVVVQQKKDLHPPFPLLSELSIQIGVTMLIFGLQIKPM